MTDPTNEQIAETVRAALDLAYNIAECGDHPDHLIDAEHAARQAILALSLLQQRADEWQQAYERIEECDCIPSIVSSRACPKCGRRGVVPEETLLSIVKDKNAAEQRADQAEKERAALEQIRDMPEKPYSREAAYHLSAARRIAREALAATQEQQ